jgi:phosphopantetheinyl transferase
VIEDARVLIVRGNYDRDFFSADELSTAAEFRLHKRREEWLLSRYAAKQLALRQGIATDPRTCIVARPELWVDGSPTTWFVSLSHSEPYAAAAIAHEPVGIDVQVIRPLDQRAAHLFLSDEETEAMRACSLEHVLLHFWSAKEAAWKQNSEEFLTLREVPLRLLEERSDGLLFDRAETKFVEDVIVAVTRPTS